MGTQKHMAIWGVGLALLLLGWQAYPVLGQQDTPSSRGVIATVTTIDADTSTATLQTEGGQVFEVWQRSRWTRGDKVLCDLIGGAHPRLQRCQMWQEAAGGASTTAAASAADEVRFVARPSPVTVPSARLEPAQPETKDTRAVRREPAFRAQSGVFDWRTTRPNDDGAQ